MIEALPQGGSRTAVLIVFLAGFSQALGQGIVLFINQVRPLRFALSLMIATILFAFGFVFWVFSTWLASLILYQRDAIDAVIPVIRTLGLSYTPLLFSIFIALPYFGIPVSIVLSVWSFISSLIGLKVALGLDTNQAFLCSALGWLVFQVLQRTIGRPLAGLGRWLSNTAAGVTLVTNLREMEELLITGRPPIGAIDRDSE